MQDAEHGLAFNNEICKSKLRNKIKEGGEVYKELSSWNIFELRIYYLFGVNWFRKLILAFEKIRHFKDKQKNENYHPSNFDMFSIERYNGFLVYNAFLHGVSLLFTLIYAVLSTVIAFRNVPIDLSIVLLTLLNVYCIMLQRTNYLKLKEYRNKYFKRFLKLSDLCKKETIQKVYALESNKLQKDYELLCRLREAFEGRADCVLSHNDIESLQRISSCIEYAGVKNTSRKSKNREALPVGLLEQCDFASRPYTTLQMQADWLERLFGVSGRKVLDCTAIITEDAECERIYRELIPEDTPYNFCLAYFLLYEVFTHMIGKVETNET